MKGKEDVLVTTRDFFDTNKLYQKSTVQYKYQKPANLGSNGLHGTSEDAMSPNASPTRASNASPGPLFSPMRSNELS